MSIVKLDSVLVDLKGLPVMEGDKQFTLKDAMLNALVVEFPNTPTDADEKLKRFKLLTKINAANGSVELTAEEISFTKAVIGKAYGALIMGQAWDLLENSVH